MKVKVKKAEAIRVRSFWYDKPDRPEGRWVLSIRVDHGPIGVRVCLTKDEMASAVKSLTNPYGDDSKPETSVWWDYGQINGEGSYDLGDTTTDEVPLMLYRDDHCYCHLPHHIGLQILGLIAERMGEISSAQAAAVEEGQ